MITIGIDDDVGSPAQRSFKTSCEGACQTQVARMAHDVIDAAVSGNGDGVISASIVNYQGLDYVDAVDVAGEIGENGRQRFFLVIAGNLDN